MRLRRTALALAAALLCAAACARAEGGHYEIVRQVKQDCAKDETQETLYERDGYGRVLRKTQRVNGETVSDERYTLDADGKKLSEEKVEADGVVRRTEYLRDETGETRNHYTDGVLTGVTRILRVRDAAGNVTHYEEQYDGEVVKSSDTAYDAAGNATRVEERDHGELVSVTERTYDDEGSLASARQYDAAGELLVEILHGPTEDGLGRREETWYAPGQSMSPGWSRMIAEYDAQGQKVSIMNYDEEGRVLYGSTWAYDGQGRVIEEAQYRDGDTPTKVTVNTWDDHDTLLTQEVRQEGWDTVHISNENYYGDDGELIYQYQTRDDGASGLTLGCTFDENGVLRHREEYDPDMRRSPKISEYDEQGRLQQESVYSLVSTNYGDLFLLRLYDEAGNMIHETRYDDYSVLESETDTEYALYANLPESEP